MTSSEWEPALLAAWPPRYSPSMAWKCCCSNQPAVKASQFKTHAMPYHFPFRGVGSPRAIRRDGAHAASEYTPFPGYYAEFSQHPYTTPKENPWDWSLRSRILGGRTLHWGRQSFRLAEYDFKAASIERLRGRLALCLSGSRTLLRQGGGIHRRTGPKRGLPQIPDGKFQTAFAFNCYEHLMCKAAAKKTATNDFAPHCATEQTA
jgi:hypothetical protein